MEKKEWKEQKGTEVKEEEHEEQGNGSNRTVGNALLDSDYI